MLFSSVAEALSVVASNIKHQMLVKSSFLGHFFCSYNLLKISGVLKKLKINCKFLLEMFCQFKNSPYLCIRFREATR